MSTGAGHPQMRAVEIRASIVEASRHLCRNKLAFMRVAAIPILLTICFSMLLFGMPYLLAAMSKPGGSSLLGLRNVHPIVIHLVNTVLLGIVGYSWMRFYLIGHKPNRPPWLPAWRKGLPSFLTGALVIATVWNLPTLMIWPESYGLAHSLRAQAGPFEQTLGLVVVVGSFVIMPYIAIRYCLVFPAAAAGHEYSLRQSWLSTRNRTLRLLMLFAAMLGPVYILIAFLERLIPMAMLVLGVWLGQQSMNTPGSLRYATWAFPGALSLSLLVVVLIKCVAVAAVSSALARTYQRLECEGDTGGPRGRVV